jgi:hypothetical protein
MKSTGEVIVSAQDLEGQVKVWATGLNEPIDNVMLRVARAADAYIIFRGKAIASARLSEPPDRQTLKLGSQIHRYLCKRLDSGHQCDRILCSSSFVMGSFMISPAPSGPRSLWEYLGTQYPKRIVYETPWKFTYAKVNVLGANERNR